MSAALLQLAFREKSSQRKELFLLDELDHQARFKYEQKLKASQIGIVCPPNRHAAYLKKKSALARIYYHNTPGLKEKKREQSAKLRRENPQYTANAVREWRKRNPEKVKCFQHKYYLRRKASMTPEAHKLWQRERDQKAKARKIAEIGIEKYRELERERVKRHYAKHPEALEHNRQRNKEAMRRRRQLEKEKQA